VARWEKRTNIQITDAGVVKILLADIGVAWARTLRELVTENNQLQIVAEAKEPIDILLHAKSAKVDIVILSQTPDGGEPGICSHLLLEYPNLIVVLVPSESGPNVLHRLVLHREVRTACKETLKIMLRKVDSQ